MLLPVVSFALMFQAATQDPLSVAVLSTRDSLRPAPSSGTMAFAALAPEPPVIDGRDADAVWRTARVVTGFRQWNPTEDGDPRFPTEARIAYDARYIYVYVRAYDPHPDSIVGLLARRDSWMPADRIGVVLDSYHDRRSGFEFWVNAAGVKTDAAISNDGDEDDVGLIWKTLSQWADVPATASELRLIASAPEERLAPAYVAGPRNVARDPVGSRAPPA